MDRQYYNQFYRFKESNAKLLKIRKQSRLSNSGVAFDNNSFLQATSGVNAIGFPASSQHNLNQQFKTLSNDSSNGSQSKVARILAQNRSVSNKLNKIR